jgi:CDP-paratose 2-epimerase
MHQIDKFNGQTYNVGGGREISASLQEMTKTCEMISGNKINIQAIPETRKADIRLYITDNTRISSVTGWAPRITVSEILEDVFLWIKNNEQQLKPILS